MRGIQRSEQGCCCTDNWCFTINSQPMGKVKKNRILQSLDHLLPRDEAQTKKGTKNNSKKKRLYAINIS